jgi:hypothetical protein
VLSGLQSVSCNVYIADDRRLVVALRLAIRPIDRGPVRVNGGHSNYVGGRSGVPQIADDLLPGTKSSASGQIGDQRDQPPLLNVHAIPCDDAANCMGQDEGMSLIELAGGIHV